MGQSDEATVVAVGSHQEIGNGDLVELVENRSES